jgi:hypothetical protein
MVTYRKLRRGLNDLRYRELSELIKLKVSLTHFDLIEAEVKNLLENYLPMCGLLKMDPYNTRLALAKYRFVELTFSSRMPVLKVDDRVDRDGLTALGFVAAKSDRTAKFDADHDPGCIEVLLDNLTPGREFVKIFLELFPKRDAWKEFMAEITRAQKVGMPAHEAVDVALERMMHEVDFLFPGTFKVTDACITNAECVWLNKHFYM